MVTMPCHLPVYSLSGLSHGQRSRFIRTVIPQLLASGLAVVTVEPPSGLSIGHGRVKDLEAAGFEPGHHRVHWAGGKSDFSSFLAGLAGRFDLVLVECDTDLELVTVVVDDSAAPAGREHIRLSDFSRSPAVAAVALCKHVSRKIMDMPVWACILIGGQSSRMGRPKHLLPTRQGMTWLEQTWRLLSPRVAGVALSGGGELPEAVSGLPRLTDAAGMAGPLAGILAAMRWRPDVAWLVLACDMPEVGEEAITWLIDQRKAGRWGVVPRLGGGQRVEPLFACYEPQARHLFENLAANSIRRASAIADSERIGIVEVPQNLHRSWRNVNTPQELQRFHDRSDDDGPLGR